MSEPRPSAETLPPEEKSPIDEVFAPVDRGAAIGRIPRIARGAIANVREAAPRQLSFAIALQVAAGLVVGAQLLVIKELVGGLLRLARDEAASVSVVVPAFTAMLVATLISAVIAALLEQQQRLLNELVARRMTDRIIDVATAVELSQFEDAGFYDALERARNAAISRPTAMVNALLQLLLGLLTSAGIVIALLTLEPLLVPLVALSGVPLLLATLRNSRASYVFEYTMTSHGRERLHLFELFTDRDAAKELRAFSATGFLRRRYDALSDERVARFLEFLRGRLRVSLLAATASAAAAGVGLASLTWLLATGRMGVATAATAAIAMQMLAGRVAMVVNSLGRLVESGLFLDDLQAFLTEGDERARTTRERNAARARAERFERLEVGGLTFTYPGTTRPVLSDVSLEIAKGEVVALVGENGSGKTSLVKVLCGLYQAPPGTVRWNGIDAEALDPTTMSDQVTVLFQDFVRYHLTVADNVSLGRWELGADEAAIEAATRQAGADGVVAGLPRGFDTRLGRQFLGGHELSGGQWQRLALARAFYRGGNLLIMDEPTAALDPRAEYALFEELRRSAKGRTTLLISHRFANVRMADRIYVLESGRVVESGDHARLMANDGLYAELFRLQAASYSD